MNRQKTIQASLLVGLCLGLTGAACQPGDPSGSAKPRITVDPFQPGAPALPAELDLTRIDGVMPLIQVPLGGVVDGDDPDAIPPSSFCIFAHMLQNGEEVGVTLDLPTPDKPSCACASAAQDASQEQQGLAVKSFAIIPSTPNGCLTPGQALPENQTFTVTQITSCVAVSAE